MVIHKGDTVEEVNEAFIKYFLPIANQAIAVHGRFNWVLTGGNSPRAVYQKLALHYADKLAWDKVFFFFGDERYVPATDANYNGKMAHECLFAPLNIPAEQIFYIPTANTPEKDAEQYQIAIDEHFSINDPNDRSKIAFDLIMLGMGDDAHTASLFPHTTAIDAKMPQIISVWVEKLNTSRITFSAPLINQAKQVAFFCFGKNKATALKHVWDQNSTDYHNYPSKLINPSSGELHWFVDQEALSAINS